MGLVGPRFAAHFVASQLFLGLRGAEQVGHQFRATHVVKNFLALLQSLAGMDTVC